MTALTNKYSGQCQACGRHVPPGAGRVEPSGRRRGKWLLWCLPCFNASDHSGLEDRECGDRAYEDRCAEACGL